MIPSPSRSALLLAAALAALPRAFAQAETPPPSEPAETGLTSLPAPAATAPTTEPAPSAVADLLAAPTPAPSTAAEFTLDQAVTLALQVNFDLRMQRLTSRSTADAEVIARADYDPTVSVSATTRQSQSTTTVDANGISIPTVGARIDNDSASLNITQRVPLGTTVTGSTSLARRDSNRTNAAPPDPSYSNDVTLTVRQPLLKGAGVTVNNAAIERAKLGTERAAADFAARVFTVVRDVEIAYANLAYAREQVAIRAFSLEVRKKLHEENRVRRETGVATDLEVLQAEVAVASAARDLLLAGQTARDREEDLMTLLGDTAFDGSIGPVSVPVPAQEPTDLTASLQRARANTPEYFSALASIRQQEIDITTARNARLPQLDLSASAGYANTDETLRNSNANLWDGNGYSWNVGASLSFPWGFREERARLRQARAGREREELRLAQVEQTILASVREAVRAVETSRESLRLSALTATLRAREFEVEKARYDSGLSTFRRVQETQDDLDQARLAELQAKVNLRTAQASLDRLEGTAAARYRLSLEP